MNGWYPTPVVQDVGHLGAPIPEGAIEHTQQREASLLSLRTLIARARTAGGLHLALSVILVQGGAYTAQIIIASILGPSAFGIVRSTEATLAVATTLAQCGLPSLAIRGITNQDHPTRAPLLGQLLGTGYITSATVAIGLGVLAPQLVGGDIAVWLWALLPTLLMVVPSRIIVGALQGANKVRDASLITALLSIVGLLLTTWGVKHYHLAGWMIGRYAAEALLTLAMVLTAASIFGRKALQGAPSPSLIVDGMPISAGLMLRSALDNAMIPMLSALGVDEGKVGQYSFSSIMLLPLLLLPGVLGNLIIPRFVSTLNQTDKLRKLLAQSVFLTVISILGTSAILVMATPVIVRSRFPEFQSSTEILFYLLVSVPARGATIPMGGLLLAAGDFRSPVVVNTICLIALVGSALLLVPLYGIRGAALTVIGAELLSLLGFTIASAKAINARAHHGAE